MIIPAEHNPVTPADLKRVFKLLAGVDGHLRGASDVDTWVTAVKAGRWTRAQLAAATLTLTCSFRGFRVMPGHVDEQIALDRERIRNRWYCPDPPHELADNPEAEIMWRRRVAADYSDRALIALATGQALDDVPLVTNPEPPRPEIVDARARIADICAGIANRKAIAAAPDVDIPEQRSTRRVRPDPVQMAEARAELDSRRPAPVETGSP